jgi:hypothetical protein
MLEGIGFGPKSHPRSSEEEEEEVTYPE